MTKEFKIAGGKKVKVFTPEYLKHNDSYKFGEFNDGSNTISVAKKVKIDNKDYPQSEEDMERTFWHEMFHCFQFYAGMECDEMVAQVFSNFMYEYMHTRKI